MAMELLMRFCTVDANVWLTWPWVNQNLRDAAVRDKSLSLALNVQLMSHTLAYLKYNQCCLITVDFCHFYLNTNKSLNHVSIWGDREMPSVYSRNMISSGLILLKTSTLCIRGEVFTAQVITFSNMCKIIIKVFNEKVSSLLISRVLWAFLSC